METPSIPVPAVAVGRRQQGRERAANVIDVAADEAAIASALGAYRFEVFRKEQSAAATLATTPDAEARARLRARNHTYAQDGTRSRVDLVLSLTNYVLPLI